MDKLKEKFTNFEKILILAIVEIHISHIWCAFNKILHSCTENALYASQLHLQHLSSNYTHSLITDMRLHCNMRVKEETKPKQNKQKHTTSWMK